MNHTIRKPICAACPRDLYFGEPIPKRQHGVMMHLGEHYCTGGKRARRFKRSDPKNHVPEWCPRRKAPCEVRLYTFKDEDTELLHFLLCRESETAISPPGYRYALKRESRTELQPSEFWTRCKKEPCSDLLGFDVELYEVLEIDDGLNPVFFYLTEEGFTAHLYFDTETVRKNKKEDTL